MAAQVRSFHHLDSLSKTLSNNNSSSPTRKMKTMSNERGEELLKAFIRKRTSDKLNAILLETKPSNDSSNKKKTLVSSSHNGKELLKVVRKGAEKLSIKENNKGKSSGSSSSSSHSSKRNVCLCSPTTHKGSFRCHLHRISASKKSTVTTEKNKLVMRMINSKLTHHHGLVEFKPQLSRFGRIAASAAEVESSHDDDI